jgi:hypothetical protein
MAFTSFNLEKVREDFHVSLQVAPLFLEVKPLAVSPWLEQTLLFTKALAFQSGSEKARSEFIIAPILASLAQGKPRFSIFSGQTFEVDAAIGLTGECDFLLSLHPDSPIIEAPVFALVEAKKQDIEGGLGQCAAQMIAAQRFNTKHQLETQIVYGCVTSGETWQFLKLEANNFIIDQNRYYLDRLELLLGVLDSIIESAIKNS